jgi:hypothetical protein
MVPFRGGAYRGAFVTEALRLILADTSFWVAAAARRDAHHEEAASLLELVGFDGDFASARFTELRACPPSARKG